MSVSNKALATNLNDETGFKALPFADWPGAFGIFKYSQRLIGFNLDYLWVIAISIVLSLLDSTFMDRSFISSIIIELLEVLCSFAAGLILVNSLHARKLPLIEAFNQALKIYINAFALTILLGLSLLVSFILLVVPFFFVLPRLLPAYYYLFDQQLGPVEALKASWHGTKGFSLKIWGVILVSVLFAILCIVIIGIYFSIAYSAAMVIVYGYINRPKVGANA